MGDETENITDALIHLRVPAALKSRWIRASRAAGVRLTDWIVQAIEGRVMNENTLDEALFQRYSKLNKLMLCSDDYREQNYAAGYLHGISKCYYGERYDSANFESVLNGPTKPDEARGFRDGLAGKPPEWLHAADDT